MDCEAPLAVRHCIFGALQHLTEGARVDVQMSKTTSITVSPDDYRMVDGVYIFDPEREDEVWKQSYAAFSQAIDDGYHPFVLVGLPRSGKSTWIKAQADRGNVYFDATSINEERRAPLVEIAESKGRSIGAVFMDTSFEICMARNKDREGGPLSDAVMERMRMRLTKPTRDEGFATISYRGDHREPE